MHEDDLPVDAHGGSWAVWLGGDANETAILSQDMTIPSSATTLNYWYRSASEDLCGYDYAYVRFGSTTLATCDLCEDNNTGEWGHRQIDIQAYRGESVNLRFVAVTDGVLNSSFFLDDVSISAITASAVPSVSPGSSEYPPGAASRARGSQ